MPRITTFLTLTLTLASPSSAQSPPPTPPSTKIDLELFERSEVDRSKGCTFALWQDDRDPATDRYAYQFAETITAKTHVRQPARIKIGGTVTSLQRVATGGKSTEFGLHEYQLYKLPGADEFVVLQLALADPKAGVVDVTSGKMSIIMRGKAVFRADVKGNASCASAIAAAPPRKMGYQDAMDACQAAAADAEPPTDFKCDWKQVVAGAPGFSLTGKYAIREKGMSGELTLLESGFGPALIGISTVTKSNNAPTCAAAFKATRNDKDVLTAKTEEPDSCRVQFISSGPNIITVTAAEGCSSYCGMGAAFAGKWQLQTKK